MASIQEQFQGYIVETEGKGSLKVMMCLFKVWDTTPAFLRFMIKEY